jgi:Leucine-rich repeat (LRR) protein
LSLSGLINFQYEESAFTFPNLVSLSLINNNLFKIPSGIADSPKLEYVNLSQNRIQFLPDFFLDHTFILADVTYNQLNFSELLKLSHKQITENYLLPQDSLSTDFPDTFAEGEKIGVQAITPNLSFKWLRYGVYEDNEVNDSIRLTKTGIYGLEMYHPEFSGSIAYQSKYIYKDYRHPVVTKSETLGVYRYGTTDISSIALSIEDNRKSALIALILNSTPQHGTLFRLGKPLVKDDTIFYKDIQNNLITYRQNGDDVQVDAFSYILSDGPNYSPEAYFFAFNILPYVQPKIISDPITIGNIGSSYSYPIMSDPIEGLTFEVSALPEGLFFADAVLQGIPEVEGYFPIQVKVRDENVKGPSQTFLLEIRPAETTNLQKTRTLFEKMGEFTQIESIELFSLDGRLLASYSAIDEIQLPQGDFLVPCFIKVNTTRGSHYIMP